MTLDSRDRGFVADTARDTGYAPATIRRYTQIGEGIIPHLLDSLRGTPLGRRECDLLLLSFMTPEEQFEVLRLVRTPLGPLDTLSSLLNAAAPQACLPTKLELRQRIWRNTSGIERTEFLSWAAQNEED